MTYQEMDKYLESIGGVFYSHKLELGPILDSKKFGVGEGWLVLLKDLMDELIALGWNRQIRQIKEKFGGLRFYIYSFSDEADDAIIKYEKMSYEICEECGEVGQTRKINGWLYTLCDNHAKEKGEQFKNELS